MKTKLLPLKDANAKNDQTMLRTPTKGQDTQRLIPTSLPITFEKAEHSRKHMAHYVSWLHYGKQCNLPKMIQRLRAELILQNDKLRIKGINRSRKSGNIRVVPGPRNHTVTPLPESFTWKVYQISEGKMARVRVVAHRNRSRHSCNYSASAK